MYLKYDVVRQTYATSGPHTGICRKLCELKTTLVAFALSQTSLRFRMRPHPGRDKQQKRANQSLYMLLPRELPSRAKGGERQALTAP